MAKEVLSSLPLQILFYFNSWYFAAYFTAECLTFIYKAETLPYERSNLTQEIILLLLLATIEFFRQSFGKRGNLTERKWPVLVSILLGLGCIVCILYFVLWQTYVLKYELIISVIQLAFIVVQIVFSIFAFISFARHES